MDILRILHFILISFTISVLSWETSDHSSDCELVLAQVIYRHGDRNPIDPYPNDPYKNETFWPEGFGQLTKIGKMQQYELGKYIRSRYDGFLAPIYSPYEILVQSSTVDRTIMSADANLAGLYPPQDNQSRWNANLEWQPIPVHNKPEDIDNTIGMKAECPRYIHILDEFVKNSDMVQKLYLENKELLQIFTNYTGKSVTDLKELEYVVDTLFIEKLYNFTLPNWTSQVFPKYESKLRELGALSFKIASYTMDLQRLKGGPLLKELIENMQGKINQTMDARRKFFMYSGHDTTVATLLNTMDIFNDISPAYCSMMMIELHRNITTNEYFVEILYRNSTESDPYKLNIPGCEVTCFMPQFLQLTASRVPENWGKECHASSSSGYDTVGMIVATMLLFILIGLCICVGLILKSYIRNKRIDPTPPKYPYLHLQMEDGDEEA